ncbi:hypothetical protein Aperf_G00000019101 [Anoplocephala perfoliata]
MSKLAHHRATTTSESPIFIESGYIPKLPETLPTSTKLTEIGVVTAVYGGIVVVQSFSNKMILDRGSALYLQNRRPLGEVYDTIGSIRKHSYVIVHENRRFKPKNGDTSEATKLEVNVTAGNVDEEKLSKKLALEDLLLKMRADEQGVNCEELTAERNKAKKDLAELLQIKREIPKKMIQEAAKFHHFHLAAFGEEHSNVSLWNLKPLQQGFDTSTPEVRQLASWQSNPFKPFFLETKHQRHTPTRLLD